MLLAPIPATKPELEYKRPWTYPKQRAAIFDPLDSRGFLARYSFIEASTKTGKTVGCIIWLFEQAWAGGRGDHYWWIAPVYGQADIAYRRMIASIPEHLVAMRHIGSRIELVNGAIIWFKSADNPDSLYGEDVKAAVVDEASRVKEDAWYAVRSTLTATQGPIRVIGNVKGRRNWFYGLARKAEAGEPNMSYHKLIAHDAVEAGVLTAEEVEDARRVLPDAVFRELYMAEPSDDEGNPFGIAAIRACVAPLSGETVGAWGWDLGKSVDWTVGVGLDRTGATSEFHRFQVDWPNTLLRIRAASKSKPALVDSTGLGDPVVEQLQTTIGTNFEGFKFTGQSKQQLMEGLAVAIQQREVKFPDGPIVKELEVFEYTYTRTGVRYGAPEGYHDDCVCALALAVRCRGSNRGLEVWEKLGRSA